MEELLKDLIVRVKSLVDGLKQELSGIRSNRPTSSLVEDIQIDYNGRMLRIKQLGSVTVVPPRTIQITVWDQDSVQKVAKALEDSKRGFVPNVQGGVIHINLPPLTEERRDELIRSVKGEAEKFRIRLRGIRDESNKSIESAFKAKAISEDQKFKSKKKVQETVDKANQDIEMMLGAKIKEIAE